MLLLWKQTILREVVFDKGEPQSDKTYRLYWDTTTQLNPETVTEENISVYSGGEEVHVETVLYDPVKSELAITIAPSAVYDSYDISLAAENLEGEALCENKTAEVMVGSKSEENGIGIVDIALFGESGRVFEPIGSIDITIRVVLCNSKRELQEKNMVVYLNDDERSPLITSKITLNPKERKEFLFGLPKRKFSADDKINIKFM